MAFLAGIYLVADTGLVPDAKALLRITEQAVAGGVSAVQVRAKGWAERDLAQLCRAALQITEPAGVPLIVNDSVATALTIGAQGVHLGQSDMPYAEARTLLGPKALIGISLEHLGQIQQASAPGLDYVAASPVFATPTKADTAPALGLDGLRHMVKLAGVPVVAIGGIQLSNAQAVAEAGAHALAVVSAICLAPDPRAATEALCQAFELGRQKSL